jgi:hypothetical protein
MDVGRDRLIPLRGPGDGQRLSNRVRRDGRLHMDGRAEKRADTVDPL